MNRTKYIIFALIFLTVTGAILRPIWLSNRDIRNADDNTAEEITLEKGHYIEGKDYKAGIYDVICMSDKGEFFASKYDKGEKYVGIEMFIDGVVDIDEGVFKLLPCTFEPMQVNEAGNYELIYTGIYTVGQEISAGTYRVYSEGVNSTDVLHVVITSDCLNDDSTIATLYNLVEKEAIASVKDGDIVWINMKFNELHEEDPNIKVILEPQ